MEIAQVLGECCSQTAAALCRADTEALAAIADILFAAGQRDACIFTAGNAGSAATASHFADDLRKSCAVCHRPGFRVQCLADSTPVATCMPNHESYEAAFGKSPATQARQGDVLCVFSASGDEENVLAAARWARENGVLVCGFTGSDGGLLLPLCEVCFFAPSDCVVRIADIHLAAVHALTTVLRQRRADAFGIEVIKAPAGHDFKIALFDFDGTLSLIREGWREDMIPYFCEELAKTPGGQKETAEEIYACAADFIDDLTGKQTIFQCMQLCEEIRKRGGTPAEPMVYKTEYLRRLMARIDSRREGLRCGTITPESLLVRGAAEIIKGLKARGVEVFCASGTDQPQVLEEAALLGLDTLFDGNIYGALDEHAQQCSKEVVLRRILSDNHVRGENLLSFGDGPVEIRLVADLGGYAVAVATDEQKKCGVNDSKRAKLLDAGALCVVPDFEDTNALLDFLFA